MERLTFDLNVLEWIEMRQPGDHLRIHSLI